ncbi:MAG: flagellar protein FliS [Acidimicrobiia bacterium]|nr:flagellar protein FliS [Acidimicrobiia bacterium]
MFTLDAVRRIPSVDSETADSALDDRVATQITTIVPEGRSADPSADPSFDADDIAEIRRRLVEDLHEADTAILTGRIEDAHRALIHAQDMVFERHLALGSTNPRRPGKRSTDLFLQLTNRLIDANRFKDRAIIAECRSLLDVLAETYAARTASGPALT